MGSVTTTPATYSQALRSVKRPDPVAVGTIVWLGSEVMFFAGLFAIYFTLRSTSPDLWAESTQLLNIPFAAVNTIDPGAVVVHLPDRRLRRRALPAVPHAASAGSSRSGAWSSGSS